MDELECYGVFPEENVIQVSTQGFEEFKVLAFYQYIERPTIMTMTCWQNMSGRTQEIFPLSAEQTDKNMPQCASR